MIAHNDIIFQNLFLYKNGNIKKFGLFVITVMTHLDYIIGLNYYVNTMKNLICKI